MTAIANHLSFFSRLSFYHSTSWRVTAGSFEEKLCWAACSMPMWNLSPALEVGLLLLKLILSRDKLSISSIG